MRDQEVIHAGVGEDLGLGERRARQTDGAVHHLPLCHVGALVSLCVRPQLHMVVSGELRHSRQVALDDFLVDNCHRGDDVLGRRENALDVHAVSASSNGQGRDRVGSHKECCRPYLRPSPPRRGR